MGGLHTPGAWGASAGLILVSVIPLGYFWVINLCRSAGTRSQPVRMAHMCLRASLPVLIMGVVLAAYSPLVATVGATRGFGSSARRAYTAAIYTELTSQFAVTVAAILGTCAVYLCALSVVYLARGGKKWWRMLRIDVICGGIILFGLDVAWWAKILADYSRRGYSSFPKSLLVVIVDIVLFLVALGAAGLALYAAPKLKKRPDVAASNILALLVSASILWLLRCTFVLAIELKGFIWLWYGDEGDLLHLIYPILDFWVFATVIGLVTSILRHPVWLDPGAIPDHKATQPAQFPHGYEQQQQQQQHPGVYQQYPPMQQPHYQ